MEMALTGQATVAELSKSFGVARKTLYKAIEEAKAAAIAALAPKKRGRKPTPLTEVQAAESEKEKEALSKELEHWKTKYEIAKTFLDLQRQDLPGMDSSSPPAPASGPGKKKKVRLRRIRRKQPTRSTQE